jgi:hypothetical protein
LYSSGTSNWRRNERKLRGIGFNTLKHVVQLAQHSFGETRIALVVPSQRLLDVSFCRRANDHTCHDQRLRETT